jgi:hypothetical protein
LLIFSWSPASTAVAMAAFKVTARTCCSLSTLDAPFGQLVRFHLRRLSIKHVAWFYPVFAHPNGAVKDPHEMGGCVAWRQCLNTIFVHQVLSVGRSVCYNKPVPYGNEELVNRHGGINGHLSSKQLPKIKMQVVRF